jgi:ABC-2 type transport system ATP-binding protein
MTENEKNSNRVPAVLMEKASHDFGGGAGVFDIDFSLKPGEILGIIGPSGCGKTTMIRMINGILNPTSGGVQVFGKAPKKFDEVDKMRVGYIPQHFILYPNLNVEENMHFIGGIFGMRKQERKEKLDSLLDFVDLSDARKRLAKKLSGGMQRRLMLAGALLHTPDILIADEPTAGIDPILRSRIWNNFRELRDEGKTLMVTTQYVGEAAFCDKVAVMRKGKLITIDTPRGLQQQAMGGEVVHIEVGMQEVKKAMVFLMGLSQVSKVEIMPGKTKDLFIFVDDASKAIPKLLSQLKESVDISPTIAEPYLPSFDEVFVKLIQNIEENLTMEQIQ